MVKKYHKVVFIISIFMFIGCSNLKIERFFNNIQRFSYYQKFNPDIMDSNIIRFDGYYYLQHDYGFIYDIYYNDGTFFSSSYIGHYDSISNNYQLTSWDRTCPWCWGVFTIYGDTLKTQIYSDISNIDRDIIEWWYLILPDGNLICFKGIQYRGTIFGTFRSESTFEKLLKFKYCPNRPDSMNWMLDDFIEKKKN